MSVDRLTERMTGLTCEVGVTDGVGMVLEVLIIMYFRFQLVLVISGIFQGIFFYDSVYCGQKVVDFFLLDGQVEADAQTLDFFPAYPGQIAPAAF